MSHSERKNLIRSRAAARGMIAVASFLSPYAGAANENLSPVPHDSRSPFSDTTLSPHERNRLAEELREYRLASQCATDAAEWHAGKARGMWLAIV